jgi:predicted dehydrogenase
MKLGIIGTGSVARYHLEAARTCGFTSIAVCAQDNSRNAQDFARNTNSHYFPNVDELLKQSLNALVIAVPVSATVKIVEQTINYRIPTLIEKPFSTRAFVPDVIMENQDLLRVAYNRRCYSSVRDALKLIQKYPNGTFEVNIAEQSLSKGLNIPSLGRAVVENSVHALDLARYMFGEMSIKDFFESRNSYGLVATFWVLTSDDHKGVIRLMSGVPENYSLNYFSPGLSLSLKPFEELSYNHEITKTIPPIGSKVGLYRKSEIPWKADLNDLEYKPGFKIQYELFREFVSGKEVDRRLTTIEDALKTTRMALDIKNSLNLI